MDSTIINLTGDKTVHFIHADTLIFPYVEYEFYDENGNAYEEGKEVETNFYLQVDIFSKGSYAELEAAIKNKLLNAGFDRGMAADLYEKETKLYHKAMRFIFSISNDEGDG